MRLLLDMGVPRRSAADLTQVGLDAIHLADLGLQRLADAQILERARLDGRVVVTLDSDFSQLLALSAAERPSVIHLRISGLDRTGATRVIRSIVERCVDDLEHGSVVTVTKNGIRVRRLPIR